MSVFVFGWGGLDMQNSAGLWILQRCYSSFCLFVFWLLDIISAILTIVVPYEFGCLWSEWLSSIWHSTDYCVVLWMFQYQFDMMGLRLFSLLLALDDSHYVQNNGREVWQIKKTKMDVPIRIYSGLLIQIPNSRNCLLEKCFTFIAFLCLFFCNIASNGKII